MTDQGTGYGRNAMERVRLTLTGKFDLTVEGGQRGPKRA